MNKKSLLTILAGGTLLASTVFSSNINYEKIISQKYPANNYSFQVFESPSEGNLSREELPFEKKIVGEKEGLINVPSETYQKRFSEYEHLFRENAKNPPETLSKKEFIALLASISQKESSMGYPRGKGVKNERSFTGYTGGKRNRGAENQLKRTAKTLKIALEGEHPYYSSVNEIDERKEKIKHTLRIYNQGENAKGRELEHAKKYAEEVYSYFVQWKNYINNLE